MSVVNQKKKKKFFGSFIVSLQIIHIVYKLIIWCTELYAYEK